MISRIKELRHQLDITQGEFSQRIRMGQSTWAMIETGKRNLNERHIKMICQEFGVREEWLRTGQGTMFDESKQTLMEILGEKIDRLSEIEIKALIEFVKLPDKHREIIMNYIKKITT